MDMMKILKWLIDKISRLYWGRNCRHCGYYIKDLNKCYAGPNLKCKKNCVIR